ncbi:MAG: hypothetical protein ACE5GX_01005 [Thermoanaerobaculia bacterium]
MSKPTAPELVVEFGAVRSDERPRRYRVAGRTLVTNRAIPELKPYAAPESTAGYPPPGARDVRAEDLRPIYTGRGWVGGRDVDVVCSWTRGLYRIVVKDSVHLELETMPGACRLRVYADVSGTLARFAALGPGLALALAERGVFSLHASAVEIGGRATLILGDSGSGKSTLAAAGNVGSLFRRIADDVVPIGVIEDGTAMAYPRFPQLKLTDPEQWIGSDLLGVGELAVLKRVGLDSSAVRSRLSIRDAVLGVLEHTVASRLFAPDLRARHLDFSIALAHATPVNRLSVPEGLDRLAETVELLATGESGR